ncbi:hypothetical protein [Luteibacter aegosomatissinici]|uniref:hypothetical protein n=1 Tax=Luteibacter aegosomatissinici TaxID=2911539 RepID=UPI001FFAF72D|nr:hypothetical protein [Luteibacter aegosomatissinici]UPG92687.1 hypothetical protein L2Y97_12505 [Luteibacter aegosomatissinici]
MANVSPVNVEVQGGCTACRSQGTPVMSETTLVLLGCAIVFYIGLVTASILFFGLNWLVSSMSARWRRRKAHHQWPFTRRPR